MALLCETHLTSSSPNRTNHPDGSAHGGSAISVRQRISHHLIPSISIEFELLYRLLKSSKLPLRNKLTIYCIIALSLKLPGMSSTTPPTMTLTPLQSPKSSNPSSKNSIVSLSSHSNPLVQSLSSVNPLNPPRRLRRQWPRDLLLWSVSRNREWREVLSPKMSLLSTLSWVVLSVFFFKSVLAILYKQSRCL